MSTVSAAKVIVRPYERRDRETVRRLCCDTANRGQPIEPLYNDRELFADLVTRYYTDYEPGATWIAEWNGQVVGYLTGCADSRRHRRVVLWRVAPSAVLHAIPRGVLCSRQSWRWASAALQAWWRGGCRWKSPGSRYPAHLHINVRDGFRGRRIGKRLVERFLDQIRTMRLSGIYAGIRSDNVRSREFFERFGFMELYRYPIVIPDDSSQQAHETIVYGKQL